MLMICKTSRRLGRLLRLSHRFDVAVLLLLRSVNLRQPPERYWNERCLSRPLPLLPFVDSITRAESLPSS